MSEHTPGPWMIGTAGPNGCRTIGTTDGLMVAVVAHSLNHADQYAQAVANARLIADAPDMRAEIERLTAERDEAIAADQEIERLRSQVARLRAVIVGLVGEDDLHGLAVMAEFLERLDHDDARKSLDAVMALLEIRPEGERSRK